jgi:diguanylate cyclase (GGDEF)-like protein
LTSSGKTGVLSLSKYLPFELDSIRNKILLFAVLATLIPSGITAWIAYSQSRRALEQRINQELLSVSSQSSRELDVWLKERLQELRTLGGYYEVSETLDPSRPASATARGRLNEYLHSVRGRLLEYAELVVLDPQGRTVATTAGIPKPVNLPADWARTLRTDNQLVGEAYWDASSRGAQIVLAVPVQRLDGQRLLGGFAARVQLSGVQQQLADLVDKSESHLFLATADGQMMVTSGGTTPEFMATKVKPGTLDRLSKNENSTVAYQDGAGEEMVGTLRRVPHVPWIVAAEIPATSAYREVRRFRNIALAIVVALLIVVSVIAYWLGLILVRPLDRLTKGAAEVAAGDLAVDLPPGGGGEVGYLTYVFNHMVSRLRESRKELDASNATLRKQNEELERLSTTDSLTGLANRRQLNRRLTEEVLRARRSKQPFAVVMSDVDHFKSYNDAMGHPAGDEVLKRVAQILRESTREVDLAARYGGEEFCVLLPETSGEMALQVAERIRSRMAVEKFPGRQITVSLGIAEFARNGDTAEAVLAAADAALYQAKRAGRDRVNRAK